MTPKPDAPHDDDPETTGHEWDGIHEFNNPLPRWWLWTFYACIVWAVGYTILYPAWPLLERATPGILGYSTRGALHADLAAFDARHAALNDRLVAMELADIADYPDVRNFAVQGGAAVFRTHCSQCHGSGADGIADGNGYPNLLDDDWLWGGSIDDIRQTVAHGIRNEDDPDARWSQMNAFGRDGILSAEEIGQVVQHVRAISGQAHDAAMAAEGAEIFAVNCASCHGAEGTGDRMQGAPNLTDAIWLYGGDIDSLTETVTNARFGVMPAWGAEGFGLTEAQIRQVAAYVHQLGGGE
jgi:cytochrome c oxidase cbb3-type subunit III